MTNYTETKQSIKIYERTYELPVLKNDQFSDIQGNIASRQQLIKTGTRPKKQLFGMITTKENISFEERFKELEGLIKDYDKLINFLTRYKESYLIFFTQLTDELKSIVWEKCQALSQLEQNRQDQESRIKNDALRSVIKTTKQRILNNVLLLGKASLLMLKKIELFSNSIQKLTEDQEAQKQILQEMMSSLREYEEVYQLQIQVAKIEKDIQQMAEVAINFEQYLSDYLAPFQGLINEVVKIDGKLNGTVSEITSLVQDIVGDKAGLFSVTDTEGISNDLLGFLVKSEEKKTRLINAFDRAKSTNSLIFDNIDIAEQYLEPESINIGIESIKNHVNQQLTQIKGTLPDVVIPQKPVSPQVKTTNQQSLSRQNQDIQADLGNGVILEMVYIPPGSFNMGSNQNDSEQPIHKVTFKKGFYMGKYPVTNEQYKQIMGSSPSPSGFDAPKQPVVGVSWDDAKKFCALLSQKLGTEYRLTNEAQWEYACVVGDIGTPYQNDNLTPKLANYNSNVGQTTTEVGSYPPNAFGLYDMHGNVWEWCEDDWHENYNNAPIDGSAWIDKSKLNDYEAIKLLRGGSWYDVPNYCRSAVRYGGWRGDRSINQGFRLGCLL